jgi:exopolysaccharide biosynthesis polyprenyl glycosylphosphotransferase
MLRSNAALFRRSMKMLDVLALALAYLLSIALMGQFSEGFSRPYLSLLAASVPIWIFVLYFSGGYRSLRERSRIVICATVFKAAVLYAGIQWIAIALFPLAEVSRNVLILYPFCAALTIGVLRIGVMSVLAHIRKLGFNSRAIIIVGVDEVAMQYARIIKSQLNWGIEIRGFVTYDGHAPISPLPDTPILGQVQDLAATLAQHTVDQVVFSAPADGRLEHLHQGVEVCRQMGLDAVLLPQLLTLPEAAQVENPFAMPVIDDTRIYQKPGGLVMKQIMDWALSTLALIALTPLLAVFAVAIKLSSPGPVFFSQYRVGLQGRRFKCFKFRTMFVDAEQRLDELRHLNEMDGPVFKIKNDPRITSIGRILRKYSLDELPQFYNVFLGDMSLVGPRPPLPAEVSQYTRHQRRRLSMKPGITCIWQVSGRNNIDFDSWVQLDLEYIDQWSIGLDVKLLLRTAATVVRGTGM